ncbi:MAG: hypothetical protein H7Y38_12245 [Armatimonadetes bacterium]|nr:hypothetical protein [Armatimonadota bacterium]
MRWATGLACLAAIGMVCGYEAHRTATAQTAQNAPLSFVRLAATDTIMVNGSVQGCGGGNRYRLEYALVPSPRITVYKDGGTTQENWNQPLPRVGVVTLTPAQVERLDNRLHYCRGKHNVGSTTHEEITVTAFHAGKATGVESYTDSTGSIDKLDDADPRDIAAIPERERSFADPRPVLSLYRLFEIAEQSGERNMTLPYKDIPREKTRMYELAEEQIRYAALEKQADAMLRTLPGFAKVNEVFTMSSIPMSDYIGQEEVFAAALSARSTRTVDKVDIYLPVKNSKPATDWNAVLPTISRVEARAKSLPWIAAWKGELADRHVNIGIHGGDVLQEREPQYDVYPAWKHAGLRGLPTYKMLLRWSDYSFVTVYVGDEDNRALLTNTNCQKKERGVWFSSLELHYSPTQTVPEYYIIAPDGSRTRNTRTDYRTPRWFAAQKSRPSP